LVLAGAFLRYGVVAPQDPLAPYTQGGGDTAWYLANGEGLLSGKPHGYTSFGVPFYAEVIPTPPLYLLFVGVPQYFLSHADAVRAIWWVQIALNMASVFGLACLAWRMSGRERAFWLVATALMVDPSMVLMPSQILTETLYLCLIVAGVMLYLRAYDTQARWAFALCGLVLGLATLTRAVALLFPLALAAHALITAGKPNWRKVGVSLALMLVLYGATVSTWTLYNLQYGRLVIASNQFMPAVWRGAVTTDGSPQENDAQLLRPEDIPDDCERDCGVQVPTQRLVEQTRTAILSDVGGYVRLRLSELAGAILQPEMTTTLGGESLRALIGTWWNDNRTWDSFLRLLNGDNFWLKSAIYAFHFGGMGLGLLGLWRGRRAWRTSLVLFSFIAYTTLMHVVMLALPRYLMPAIVCYWAFVPLALFTPPTRSEAP
jgi:4-amino-4-deoxy-L-arabinose transferase-like glycosyltransferase